MHLKQLDVVGFKSFANRITVDFVTGVTAVVGPNGSGKSNITDAIRWVLGEQSAKSLRGTKMEDIIFAGSDTRKQQNFAEVTLTLENEDQFLPVDYNEVSVTRRVFRSGESEFFINKQSCRLKDITDLFLDSGLGKEAFSIISQGKVEEILSSKPEERRTIFEEAAGVLKYKQRKKKAEGKLSETQENLNRVEDILHELEGQVEPLRIQSEQAKEYIEVREKLKNLEIALLVHDIEIIHTDWEAAKQTLDELQKQEAIVANDINIKQTELHTSKENASILESKIDELQEKFIYVSQEIEKLDGQKQVLFERKKNMKQNQSQLEKISKDLKDKIDEYDQQLHTETENLTHYEAELDEKKKALRLIEDQLELGNKNIDEEIELLKSEYIDLLNKQATYRNELKHTNEQIDMQQRKSQKISENKETIELKLKNVLNNKEEINQEIHETKKKGKTIVENLSKLRDVKHQQKFEIEQLENKYTSVRQNINQLQSRKEILESMQDDYAGFFQGVKEVLKAKLQGVEGALCDLISVSKEYEVAIETALGAAMQHIVVEKEADAREAIQFLKNKKAGRATFLPMTVIKAKSIPSSVIERLKNNDDFIGVAGELVSYKDKHTNVVLSSLGNVIITRNLKSANDIARILEFRYRIVTLDGNVVNPGGSMTGGAVKQNTNSLLGRQRELQEITRKLKEIFSIDKNLASEIQTKRNELIEMNQEEDALINKKNELHEQLQEQNGKLQEISLNERNLSEQLRIINLEFKAFDNEKIEINNKQELISSELGEIDKKSKEFEQQIEMLTNQKKLQQSSKEALQDESTKFKVEVAEMQERFTYQNEKVMRIKNELKQTKVQLENTKNELKQFTEEITNQGHLTEEIDKKIVGKEEEKTKVSKDLTIEKEKRNTHQLDVQNKELELEAIKKSFNKLLSNMKEVEVKINRLDVDLDHRLTRLREEYTLSYDGAKESYQLTISATDAQKEIKQLKISNEVMGNVNLGAIEEYERVSTRYEFLTSQQSDLLEAKETLHQVISEMDQEMKNRFETYFFQIKDHFEVIFKELFGGGRADLVLTNPEDMLHTGVDIIAQPPGKKLQNLGLLSGGERALTAIALLFAILRVRPVPFCVLDEVEAALDDANVSRFAKYLKQFSQVTQFIVITHRKGTMEEADALYGVTMQESGVSRLVSVKLEESNEFVTSP